VSWRASGSAGDPRRLPRFSLIRSRLDPPRSTRPKPSELGPSGRQVRPLVHPLVLKGKQIMRNSSDDGASAPGAAAPRRIAVPLLFIREALKIDRAGQLRWRTPTAPGRRGLPDEQMTWAPQRCGLGSRGPDPKSPWTALDALGGEPRVALELGGQRSLGARHGCRRRRRRFFFRRGSEPQAPLDERRNGDGPTTPPISSSMSWPRPSACVFVGGWDEVRPRSRP
jgi:hypothetical protein